MRPSAEDGLAPTPALSLYRPFQVSAGQQVSTKKRVSQVINLGKEIPNTQMTGGGIQLL